MSRDFHKTRLGMHMHMPGRKPGDVTTIESGESGRAPRRQGQGCHAPTFTHHYLSQATLFTHCCSAVDLVFTSSL